MKKIKNDFEILAKYSDKYIAYSDKILNIIASGATMQAVEKELKKKNISTATITYIPPANKSFSPYGSC